MVVVVVVFGIRLVVESLEMRLLSVLFCCEASASEHRAPAWSKCVLAAKDEDESS